MTIRDRGTVISSLRFEEKHGVLIVYFADARLMAERKVQEVGKDLMVAADRACLSKKMLVNFQGVQFMSSSMIGKLVMLRKRAAKDGISLKLCNITSNIMEVFKITRLNKLFDIDDEAWIDHEE